jgi:hypothetical protein
LAIQFHSFQTESHSETALFYSSYFSAAERDRICLHFWYSLQHTQSIESVAVDVTSLEADTRRLWHLENPASHEVMWNSGQVEVRAVGGLDYSVAFAVVRGAKNVGHYAIDDLTFTKLTSCHTVPSYAVPSTNESKCFF